MDMGAKYREINKMVGYFTAQYWGGEDIPYQVQGRPSEIDHTNMTLLAGKHSYYVGASKYKLYIYELGTKAFPDQLVGLEDIEDMDYTEGYIMFKYKGKTLYLDLVNSDNSYLKEE